MKTNSTDAHLWWEQSSSLCSLSGSWQLQESALGVPGSSPCPSPAGLSRGLSWPLLMALLLLKEGPLLRTHPKKAFFYLVGVMGAFCGEGFVHLFIFMGFFLTGFS